MTDSDAVDWLLEWYLHQCDGDWEHCFGIKIETLDNPGWAVSIDLARTGLEDKAFRDRAEGTPSHNLKDWQAQGSWCLCYIENKQFRAFCGPLDLTSAIAAFRAWVQET